ncbi:hypothetical protein [Bifidobacterium samirii]|uniref:Uncharacterized protein n=1 Tax=Bifidobacterium samirii TaxID=2306974 RepID=A0A430FG32_9BIFI|nr:hypothetical protein [Bifidobacterium samirii]RSX51809.1 hypothetical protein D2E24_1836 [Bifidobacterium samirii]
MLRRLLKPDWQETSTTILSRPKLAIQPDIEGDRRDFPPHSQLIQPSSGSLHLVHESSVRASLKSLFKDMRQMWGWDATYVD